MTRIPELATKRLRFDGFQPSDAPDLAAILAEPEVCKNITADGSSPERCLASAAKRIDWHNSAWHTRGYGTWAVRSADRGIAPPGTLIGWCGFAEPDIGEDPEIVYGLAPGCWGNGVATEAAAGAIDWLFARTGAAGVSAIIFHRLNAASIRIVQKLGLTLRGTMALEDFYSSTELAWNVLGFERWRLSAAPFRDARTLLFESPYRIGQLTTLGLADGAAILPDLCAAARHRPDFAEIDRTELTQIVTDAFQLGVSEPYLEWYHMTRPV